jgi:hypothetical protein
VKIPNQANRRTRLAILLIGIVVVADLILGIYHLTHGGGWVSGTIELFFACLIAASVYMFYKTRIGRNSVAKYNRYHVASLGMISTIALTLLILSLYHFTHHGFTSGIIELILAIIWATIGFLIVNLI